MLTVTACPLNFASDNGPSPAVDRITAVQKDVPAHRRRHEHTEGKAAGPYFKSQESSLNPRQCSATLISERSSIRNTDKAIEGESCFPNGETWWR